MNISRPGIYCITNRINNKIYIGSSVNIKSRWKSHRSSSGRSASTLIGKAIRKYGISNFHFGVLEFCPENRLISLEQEWIDAAQPFNDRGYNISRIAERSKGAALALQKKVYQVEPSSGAIISCFGSIKEAATFLGVNASNIESVIQGKNNTAAGFTWVVDALAAKPVTIANSTKKRPVMSYLPSGEPAKFYESARSAAKELGISNTSILRVCSGNKKTANGLVWKYIDDYR